MKSFFKFFLYNCLIIFNFMGPKLAWANPIGILITYNKNYDGPAHLKQYLSENFSFPSEVMELGWQKDPCQKQDGPLLQICINDMGEISIVSIDSKNFKESFEVFLKSDI